MTRPASSDLGIDSIVLIGVVDANRTVARQEGRSERADQVQLDRARSRATWRTRTNCRARAWSRQLAGDRASAPASCDRRPPRQLSRTLRQLASPPAGTGADTCGVTTGFPVAVIGIACRFPGATDKETFWRNLAGWRRQREHGAAIAMGCPGAVRAPSRAGEDGEPVGRVHRRGRRREPGALRPGAGRSGRCGSARSVSSRRPVSPPCWTRHTTGLSMKGRRVGVFAGARASRYAERIAFPDKHSVTGVGQNFIAAFVSHVLDLRGPSLVLDSACSSSLAAVHLACQSLQSGDSELAIAGGVDLLLDEKPYLFLSAAHALSPDGRCRTFDEKANGFVPGEGVGCVLLKPLAQALADGDHVYAVIDGSAINNDGRTLGITTPGVEGQVDVIERALQKAGAPPSTVSYIEAHGTGTMIGDPIELRALARAFARILPRHCAHRQRQDQRRSSALGGGDRQLHQSGAGAASPDLAADPALRSGQPALRVRTDAVRPVVEARPWATVGGVRRAGISAFGFGKTNVHVVVSERPAEARRPVDLEAATPAIAEADKIYAWHPPALGVLSGRARAARARGLHRSNHSPRHERMGTTRIRSQFTVRDTDPLVNSHRVQDIHILPGVAMLDAVYKTLQAQRMDLSVLALRGILFHEPVVTNAQIDRKLTVTVDMRGAEGRITVTSLPWKNDRALAADPTTHMTCLAGAERAVRFHAVACLREAAPR